MRDVLFFGLSTVVILFVGAFSCSWKSSSPLMRRCQSAVVNADVSERVGSWLSLLSMKVVLLLTFSNLASRFDSPDPRQLEP